MELTIEQQRFAQKCVETWMRIMQDEGRGSPSVADASHSALLAYLLAGNKPFEKAPPKRYSYPCYAFAEGQEVLCSMYLYGAEDWAAFGKISIDQYTGWDWPDRTVQVLVAKNGDKYEFTYADPEYLVSKTRYASSVDWTHEYKIERFVEDIKTRGDKNPYIILKRIGGPAPRME